MSDEGGNVAGGLMVFAVVGIGLVLPHLAHIVVGVWLIWTDHWLWALIVLFPGLVVFRLAGTMMAGIAARIIIALSGGPSKWDL